MAIRQVFASVLYHIYLLYGLRFPFGYEVSLSIILVRPILLHVRWAGIFSVILTIWRSFVVPKSQHYRHHSHYTRIASYMNISHNSGWLHNQSKQANAKLEVGVPRVPDCLYNVTSHPDECVLK